MRAQFFCFWCRISHKQKFILNKRKNSNGVRGMNSYFYTILLKLFFSCVRISCLKILIEKRIFLHWKRVYLYLYIHRDSGWLFKLDLSHSKVFAVECYQLEAEIILDKKFKHVIPASSATHHAARTNFPVDMKWLFIPISISISPSLFFSQCLRPVWPVLFAHERPLWPAPALWTVLATAHAHAQIAVRALGRSATPWKCPAEPSCTVSHTHI